MDRDCNDGNKIKTIPYKKVENILIFFLQLIFLRLFFKTSSYYTVAIIINDIIIESIPFF